MLHNENQPKTKNNAHFAKHRFNAPISQLAKTVSTHHTPGDLFRNSSFSQKKEGYIPKMNHRFPREIAHFCAKLSKIAPIHAFLRQIEPPLVPKLPQRLWYGLLTTPQPRNHIKKTKMYAHQDIDRKTPFLTYSFFEVCRNFNAIPLVRASVELRPVSAVGWALPYVQGNFSGHLFLHPKRFYKQQNDRRGA